MYMFVCVHLEASSLHSAARNQGNSIKNEHTKKCACSVKFAFPFSRSSNMYWALVCDWDFFPSFDIHKIDDWELNTISIWKDTRARFGNEFLLYFDKSALIHQKKKKRTKRTSHKFRNSEKKHAFRMKKFQFGCISSLILFKLQFTSFVHLYTQHTMCTWSELYRWNRWKWQQHELK